MTDVQTLPAEMPGVGDSDQPMPVVEEYVYRSIISNDLGSMSFDEAINGTIVEFDDGDIVTGTVVKIDKDEVLLDIGYKSEGVIQIGRAHV